MMKTSIYLLIHVYISRINKGKKDTHIVVNHHSWAAEGQEHLVTSPTKGRL